MAFYYKSSTNSDLHSSILLFLSIMILSVLPIPTYSSYFDFPSFSVNERMIHLEGDSFLVNSTDGFFVGGDDSWDLVNSTDGGIELTHEGFSAGRATYSEPVQLWDAPTGRVSDFDTQFSFRINQTSSEGPSDGLAFFLAPFGLGSKLQTISEYGGWGTLGLINETGENLFVAVEFDTYTNGWDPDHDRRSGPYHVGIDIKSLTSAVTEPLLTEDKVNLTHADQVTVWVNYNSTARNLSVYLVYNTDVVSNVYFQDLIVSYIVDLSKILPENVTVGFSASTQTGDRHKILRWRFYSSPLDVEEGKNPSNNNTNIYKGRDGETSERSSTSKSLLVGVAVGIGVLGCALGFAFFIWLKKRRTSRNLDDDTNFLSTDDEFEKETGPKRFTYSELAHATSNFDEAGKLGEGGFGGVYKGVLGDSSLDIAVKRISSESKQGKKEYQSEVKIISQLRHRNLVQLIGWCHERNELLLVYEFMPNRSLDKHLFRGENVLTWDVRHKIATGLASALLYLHEEWEQCVVHRDVKSSNVMLDSNFNPKLGDFGLARFVDHDLGSQTTVVAGTIGYLAPECIFTGKFNKESDVYSFGIVALEIACGRKPVEINKLNLVEWVWELYGNGKIVEAVDERLNRKFENQIQRIMVMGLWCAHPDPTIRPSIRQVVNILNDNESPLVKLPTKLPAPVFYAPPMNMCKLAFASAFGDYSNSQMEGSQCNCSSCSNSNLSQTTVPSASYSSS
ncbi:hypothetical protein MKW94_001773 [Papaver nudicaule]|uniref:non-specific serine/threonine protein kinase n=1 Tax=Papaver nudicaule TaxID=74823 RepID=A0AA41S8H2_PAPNU|nr:hypothetical protein [Papaver nudicaule]